jgi:hypothetical protein
MAYNVSYPTKPHRLTVQHLFKFEKNAKSFEHYCPHVDIETRFPISFYSPLNWQPSELFMYLLRFLVRVYCSNYLVAFCEREV